MKLALWDMFDSRRQMHLKIYQHPSSSLLDRMVVDALWAADPHLKFMASDGTSFRLSHAVKNVDHFLMLTDDFVFHTILHSAYSLQMKTAQAILHRVQTRQLYTFVAKTQPVTDLRLSSTKDMVRTYARLILSWSIAG